MYAPPSSKIKWKDTHIVTRLPGEVPFDVKARDQVQPHTVQPQTQAPGGGGAITV